jgi:hypothetical protein
VNLPDFAAVILFSQDTGLIAYTQFVQILRRILVVGVRHLPELPFSTRMTQILTLPRRAARPTEHLPQTARAILCGPGLAGEIENPSLLLLERRLFNSVHA